MTHTELESLISKKAPLILDGGLGSELARRGHDLSSPLWSAKLLIDHPQAIAEVHRSYLDAGAQCITTASYQASIPGFASMGVGKEQARTLFCRSVEVAIACCEEFFVETGESDFRPLVAASVGPYGAYLADGSEYRGDYGVDDAELVEFHRHRLAWLDATPADLIACETIPGLQEARVLCELLGKVETPAWVAFSCRNGRELNDGSRLGEVAALFRRHPKVVALGVNCSAPQIIGTAIAEIKSVLTDKAIVVYPNSGEHYDAASKSWHGMESPSEIGVEARSWLAAGAGLIGGCCRMGPAHIQAIAAALTTESA